MGSTRSLAPFAHIPAAPQEAQLEADRKWFPIGVTRRGRLKAIVYVVDGVVTRVRAVDPDGRWIPDDRGYMEYRSAPR